MVQILVIEDEKAIQELIKLNLLPSGYEMVQADNSLKGLNKRKRQSRCT